MILMAEEASIRSALDQWTQGLRGRGADVRFNILTTTE